MARISKFTTCLSFYKLNFKSSTKLTDYSCVQQPVSVQTPPPVDPAAQGTNQSSPAPALSPDQARKPGQNFRCLWQACKR